MAFNGFPFGLGQQARALPVAPVLAPLGSLVTSRPRATPPSAFTTPARYGSGAGSHPQPAPGLRRTRVRSRSSDETGRPRRRAVSVPRRSQPAGPQEGAEWLDALNDARNAIETLRNHQRHQVEGSVKANDRIEKLENVVEALNTQISALNSQTSLRIDNLGSQMHDVTANLLPSLETAFAPLAAVEQLRLYATSIETSLTSLTRHVGQFISTPSAPVRQDDGMQDDLQTPGNDPWRNQQAPAPEQAVAPDSRPGEPTFNSWRASSPTRVPGIPTGAATDRFNQAAGKLPQPIAPGQSVSAPCPAPSAVPQPGFQSRQSQPYAHVWNQGPNGQRQADPRYMAPELHRPTQDHPRSMPTASALPTTWNTNFQAAADDSPFGDTAKDYAQMPPNFNYLLGPHMGNTKDMHRKSDSLRKFTGQAENFTTWSDHIVDHMVKVHPAWRYALTWLSKTDTDLSYETLQNLNLGPFKENALDLSTKFEQVIMDWVPERLYLRRAQLAGGKSQKGNGFAVWRKLFREFSGEGEIIEYAGTKVLREFGQCKKLSDVTSHIDSWYELFDEFGAELADAHMTTRGMFLDILPTELRTEILKEPKLARTGHRGLAEWCRSRVIVLTSEALAETRRKELTQTIRGRVNAILPSEEDQISEVGTKSAVELPDDAPAWAKQMYAMVCTPCPPVNAIAPRNPRDKTRQRSPGRGRSGSPGRNLLPDWGNKCFHCGSDKHTRNDCPEFKEMMSKANVGVPKKDWKPPAGYKSAIAKARDAARLKLKDAPKPKAKAAAKRNKINAVTTDDEDTASDSDLSDGERPIRALRRFQAVGRGVPISHCKMPIQNPICTMNSFEGLDQSQTYDPETLASLNQWHVKVTHVKQLSKKKRKVSDDSALTRDVKFISSNRRPREEPPIIVSSVKDLENASANIKPLPTDRKGLTAVLDKISKITLEPDERLVMVDSGSFCHAIDAEAELPNHAILTLSPTDRCSDAESACGGIMKRLGKVRTKGLVDGHALDVKWNFMKVKVPILSVRKLVRDNHNVKFRRDGGYILNLQTRERIPFFEHQGVYYLKMKFLPPDTSSTIESDNESSFPRPEP